MNNIKFILGGAQIGNKYGFFSRRTKMKDVKEIEKIFNLSTKSKIEYIDTANDYKNSEELIGNTAKNRFKIISKIKISQNINFHKLEVYIYNNLNSSLKRLNKKKIDFFLLHNVDNFLKSKKFLKKIYEIFKKLKKEGKIRKFGISSYYPEKMHRVYKHFKFEVVQVPFNIFDQRLLESNIYKLNKFNKIEIHVRSIFLQGILLTKNYPIYFKKWKKDIQKYLNFLNKNNLNSIQACLLFVKNFKKFKGIIFGVQNYNQLKEVLKFNDLETKINHQSFKKLKITDKNLLIPSNWIKSR